MTKFTRRSFLSLGGVFLGTIESRDYEEPFDNPSSDILSNLRSLPAEHRRVLKRLQDVQEDYEEGLPREDIAHIQSQVPSKDIDDILNDLKRVGLIYSPRVRKLRVLPMVMDGTRR